MMIDVLEEFGYRWQVLRDDQVGQPSSRLRKSDAVGSQIDFIATKHADITPVNILTDTCFHIGTDHDMLQVEARFRSAKALPRIRTGRRVLVSKPTFPQHLDQEIMQNLAQKHTKAPRSSGYKDSEATKVCFRVARRCKTAEAWKRALMSRKEDRARWATERLEKAASEDWSVLKELRSKSYQGWQTHFVESCGDEDPHAIPHQHYSKIFAGGDPVNMPDEKPPQPGLYR